jgi:hypothetical protein
MHLHDQSSRLLYQREERSRNPEAEDGDKASESDQCALLRKAKLDTFVSRVWPQNHARGVNEESREYAHEKQDE